VTTSEDGELSGGGIPEACVWFLANCNYVSYPSPHMCLEALHYKTKPCCWNFSWNATAQGLLSYLFQYIKENSNKVRNGRPSKCYGIDSFSFMSFLFDIYTQYQ